LLDGRAEVVDDDTISLSLFGEVADSLITSSLFEGNINVAECSISLISSSLQVGDSEEVEDVDERSSLSSSL
jgi:hypothetical protein